MFALNDAADSFRPWRKRPEPLDFASHTLYVSTEWCLELEPLRVTLILYHNPHPTHHWPKILPGWTLHAGPGTAPRAAAAKDGKSDATGNFHNARHVGRSASTVSMMGSRRSTAGEKCIPSVDINGTNNWLATSRIYKNEYSGWNRWSRNRILASALKMVHG
jgi:hypothetical protein